VRLVKRLNGLGLIALTVLLASCHRPVTQAKAPADAAPAAATAAPVPIGVEKPGPVRWNATTGGFELNGKPMKTAKLWTFEGSTDGFTGIGSAILPAPGQGLAVTLADPTLRSPKGLDVPGATYPLVVVRLTRTAPGAVWDTALYYATAGHGEAIKFFGKPAAGANPAVGETATLVYDMGKLVQGGSDWTQSMIGQIRLDLEDKPGGAFVIRQIAIAENPDPTAFGPATPAPAETPVETPAAKPAKKH
jgi:hypothetical protein